MVVAPIEYIKRLGIIKDYISLFNEFTGLDLEIFEVNGVPIRFFCSLKKKNRACPHKFQSQDCNKIKHEILEDVILSKTARIYFCPFEMKKLLVPLSLNGDVIGIFFAGENDNPRIDKKRLGPLSNLLSLVTNYIIGRETNSMRHFKGNALTHQQQLLHKVIKYIEESAQNEPLSLKKVAYDNAVSYHYLSHLFRQELNTTFVKFREKVKMDLAVKLLKDFTLTVSQISYACGFDDPSYFSKVFRRVHGYSALNFRKKIIKNKIRNNNKNRSSNLLLSKVQVAR